jgi:hypothetical protein
MFINPQNNPTKSHLSQFKTIKWKNKNIALNKSYFHIYKNTQHSIAIQTKTFVSISILPNGIVNKYTHFNAHKVQLLSLELSYF